MVRRLYEFTIARSLIAPGDDAKKAADIQWWNLIRSVMEPHLQDLGGFVLDIVAKEYARLPEKLQQRFADMEERNERRLNEIENAMIREQRRQFKELREENHDLKNMVTAAKRKANGSEAHP